MDQEPAVRIRQVSHGFRDGAKPYLVIRDINIIVCRGTFVSIVGPSGCGKTTLLNLVAGLLKPDAGVVEVLGRPLVGLNRDASYVSQEDSLLPWKTVTENIALGLRFRGTDRSLARRMAQDWTNQMRLSAFAESYPHQLSGGMRKRVSVAQAWIVHPEIVLMDEPFASLDVFARQRIGSEIVSLSASTDTTVIFVTHDLEEAISLSDKVIVMSSGPASGILEEYDVTLPRPRNVADMKLDSRFIELYTTIWRSLRKEVREET